MPTMPLQPVAEALLRLARRQGYILARDVRAELRSAGMPEEHWKEVLVLTRPALVYRLGRYYHRESFSSRLQKEHAQQHAIQKAVRRLIKEHRHRLKQDERRSQARIHFIHPVTLRTEEGKKHTLVSRDLSATGIRLLGTQRLLGQKVQLDLPGAAGEPPCRMLVRILWTCAVGDDLFENGGSFLEVLTGA